MQEICRLRKVIEACCEYRANLQSVAKLSCSDTQLNQLLPALKEHLEGRRFQSEDDWETAVKRRRSEKDSCRDGMEYDKCEGCANKVLDDNSVALLFCV
jgi:hypothetical protein